MLGGEDAQTRGVYSDIYDGSVWKRFVTNGFLREETSLALQLIWTGSSLLRAGITSALARFISPF